MQDGPNAAMMEPTPNVNVQAKKVGKYTRSPFWGENNFS